MHIGLLTPALHHQNGWSHYSLSTIQALLALDDALKITIVSAQTSPTYPEFSQKKWLPTVTPPELFTLPKMLLNVPRIRHELRHCDLIHATVEPYSPLAMWVKGNRPSVLTIHGSYVHLPKIRGKGVGLLYQRAFEQSQLVCVSHYTESIAHKIVPQARTTVINNGVDIERFDNLHNQPQVVPTIITVGGVKRRKGTLELVQAVARVRQQIPDVQCMIIGNPEAELDYARQVRAEIQRLQLEKHVHLLGYVADEVLLGWYAKAHVFVLPSINAGWKFEGYGLVHAEASAAGIPVIGTWGCGAEDAIEHNHTGLLVSQENIADELPDAILKILTNSELARSMGRAGREKMRQQTWQHTTRHLLNLYQQLLTNA